MPTRVPSSHPPRITTRSRMRSALTKMLRRRRAALADIFPGFSGLMTVSLDSLLIALIANQYLVAKIFPDFMIQLDKTRIETDLRYIAWTWQIDGIDSLDGARPRSEDAHTVS